VQVACLGLDLDLSIMIFFESTIYFLMWLKWVFTQIRSDHISFSSFWIGSQGLLLISNYGGGETIFSIDESLSKASNVCALLSL